MTYNLIKTIKVGTFLEIEEDQAPALTNEYHAHSKDHWHRWIERKPIQLMIVSLVVVAIGGLKSVWGAVAGATFLILLPEVAAPLQELNQLVYGLVLILVFRFAPHGIMGIIESIRDGVFRLRLKRMRPSSSTRGAKD